MLGNLFGRLVNNVVFAGRMLECAGEVVSCNATYAMHVAETKIHKARGKSNPNVMGVEEALANYYNPEDEEHGNLKEVKPEDIDAIMQEKVEVANATIEENNNIVAETKATIKEEKKSTSTTRRGGAKK